MHVQPRLLTIILASEDSAKTYTTIHSVQGSRYRNHEIVCIIPYNMRSIRLSVARDFKWLPVISVPNASVSTLITHAIEHARLSYCEALCFVQAGTTLNRDFFHKLTDEMRLFPEYQLYIPAVLRADGSGTVYGALNPTRWPHMLQAVTEETARHFIESRFMGGACAMRLATALKFMPKQTADELALLYWTEYILNKGLHSVAISNVTVHFDGPLFCDFSEMILVPEHWYLDARAYVLKYGTWYHKLAFLLRYRWRLQSSALGRFIESEHHARAHDE